LALTSQFDCLGLVDQDAVKWSTVALLTAAIVDRYEGDRRWDRFRGRLLERIMKFILDNLEDISSVMTLSLRALLNIILRAELKNPVTSAWFR
jgi:hypothetical protein